MGLYDNLQTAPPDAILTTATLFKNDTHPKKINLGIGAYRTEDGKPFVLPVVKKAEEKLLAGTGTTYNKEYLPIDGIPTVKAATQKLMFGSESDKFCSCQALSGTGALRVLAEFVKRHLPPAAHNVCMSNPTWGNHKAIFEAAGLKTDTYPYWDEATRGLNFDGMMAKIQTLPPMTMVLLHAVAHNPTGVDLTPTQWETVVDVMKQRKLIPLLDSAYQGYASGDLVKDRFAAELIYNSGMEFFAAQSFAKNLGLYGERIGMVHIMCESKDRSEAVLSQVKLVIRQMYSSPPCHGAQLIDIILNDPTMTEQWKVELNDMANRINEVRHMVRTGLEKKGTPGTWNHITDQIGMFSFTGLNVAQCEKMIKDHHVYLLKSGRISLAGLNKGNVDYFVNAVDDVVRNVPQAGKL